MLTLVSKDSVKISDHFDVLCVFIACTVLEIINQMSKNQKSSLIVWNTVLKMCLMWFPFMKSLNYSEVNCEPLSETTCTGSPYAANSVRITSIVFIAEVSLHFYHFRPLQMGIHWYKEHTSLKGSSEIDMPWP